MKPPKRVPARDRSGYTRVPKATRSRGPVYILFVLHAHLPYIRHPDSPVFFEESWLFEAITECYLPLLQALGRLHADRVACPVTLSVSPTLLEMLADPILQSRYLRYGSSRMALAEKLAHTASGADESSVARMYEARFRSSLEDFEQVYAKDLRSGVIRSSKTFGFELITTAATHGFLPYLDGPAEAVRAQLGIAAEYAGGLFGAPPRGLWLPECGYYRGLDRHIRDAGFRHFFLDGHGLLFASPTPEFGPFEPVRTPAGCVAFGRDTALSGQVWSGNGYPGDPAYREFHDDAVYRLSPDDVQTYIHPDGLRIPSGLKLKRVTGPSHADKGAYFPSMAAERVREHAADFVRVLSMRAHALRETGVRRPVIVCAFDAELFGHWWYEGPLWIEELFRLLARQTGRIRAATAAEIAADYGAGCPEADPAPSSWGKGGFGEAWLGKETDEYYPELRNSAQILTDRVSGGVSGRRSQAGTRIEQATRELLLAQSSDWYFMLRQNTSAEYARTRIVHHLDAFRRLMREDADREAMQDAGRCYGEALFRHIICSDYYRPEDRYTDRPSSTR